MKKEKSIYKSGYNYKVIRREKVKSIPSFSYKSAFIIVLTATLTTNIIPYMFGLVGMEYKVIPLLANSIGIPLAVCYCQSYIETKKGFNKNSIKIFILLALFIAIISYLWLYTGVYIY